MGAMTAIAEVHEMVDSVRELVNVALAGDVDGVGGEEIRREFDKAEAAANALDSKDVKGLPARLQEVSALLEGVADMVEGFDPSVYAKLMADDEDADA
ncbi:hypothetical protein BIV57_18000 [Mangrovactinospora gilvigrisea]|uniref:Uncharacterized protein n=1 Tax=Mangrovactinospora gilvigrisea TaxID=1428644 RepID=A0A1J7BBU9_9ACTN|nr:hypothetical protein [Mangrovactinospora gilvigrisea]OIV36131.1 hypothetical protein BIV57_18000 [Mangrovactinospora gilvigrisea]